jgi:hypothetical protein
MNQNNKEIKKSGFLDGRIRFNILMNIAIVGLSLVPFFCDELISILVGLFFSI